MFLFHRRDSFITHRAFCDALAQESARNLNPPSLNSIGSHLLGLSQMSTQDHHHHQMNHQPMASTHHDMLRLGNSSRPGPQLDNLMSPQFHPSPSSSRNMQPSQSMFMQSQVPNNEENQPPLGLMQTNKSSTLHGLMQLPQINNNASIGSSSTTPPSLFNLSFYPSNNNNTSAMNGGHHSGGGEDSNLFSSGIFPIQILALVMSSQRILFANVQTITSNVSDKRRLKTTVFALIVSTIYEMLTSL